MTWHRMRETSSDSRSGICCNPIKNSVQASASERVIKHDLFVQARAIPHYRAATLHDGYVKVANFGAAGPFPLNANQATARQLNDLIPLKGLARSVLRDHASDWEWIYARSGSSEVEIWTIGARQLRLARSSQSRMRSWSS